MHQFLKFVCGIKPYMFRTFPLSIIRSFSLYTQQWYVIQFFWLLASRIRKAFRPDPSCLLSAKPVWHIPLLCVQWKTPDDGQRNGLKHVEFYSKHKFEKLVHLVGFIIRIYHDARSPERQIWKGDGVSFRDRTHWWRDSCMLTPGIEALFSSTRAPSRVSTHILRDNLTATPLCPYLYDRFKSCWCCLKTRGQ